MYDRKPEDTSVNDDQLQALKIAFTYMPNKIEVTQYEYGERYQKVLDHIEFVRGVLLDAGVDPDEIPGDINPDGTPNSCY